MARRKPPATSVEEQERRLGALAMELAEQQLMDGTASSQVITQCLKMSSRRSEIELELLVADKTLKAARTEQIQESSNQEELYKEVLAAMSSYRPTEVEDEDLY